MARCAKRRGDWAAALPDAPLGDICFTANAGRAQLSHRAACLVENAADAAERLRAIAAGDARPDVWYGQSPSDAPRVGFLFTGQGAQQIGMGRQLYDTLPSFRQTIDRCDEVLRPLIGRSIRAVMHGGSDEEAILNQTAFAQPALFALEYALAELWKSWGLQPTAVLGHSLGEYVAACVAGVFTLEDALSLVAARGRLMQRLCRPGAMAAVSADEETIRGAIAGEPELSIAAINGAGNIVLSGDPTRLDAVLGRLAARGVAAERLVVSHAFHSPLIDPMLDEFERAASTLTYSMPRLRVVSNLTGEVARGEMGSAEYWRRHVREPVRFASGLARLRALGCTVFVEMGPRPTLLGLGRREAEDQDLIWAPSLRPGRDDWRQMLETAARLYTAGVALDWRAYDRDYQPTPVTLPSYPFERQRCWFDVPAGGRPRVPPVSPDVHRLLGRRLRSASKDLQFETRIDPQAMSWLADHVKLDSVVFPAACLLEMGAAAAEIAFGDGEHGVDDLVVSQPLTFGRGDPVIVQTIVTLNGKTADMRVCSVEDRADGDAGWRLHATAVLRCEEAGSEPASSGLAAVRRRCADVVDPAVYYERMRADGHQVRPLVPGHHRAVARRRRGGRRDRAAGCAAERRLRLRRASSRRRRRSAGHWRRAAGRCERNLSSDEPRPLRRGARRRVG